MVFTTLGTTCSAATTAPHRARTMAVNEHRPTVADVKFQVKEGSSLSSATFIFGDEDHTLGNALRHVLMQNKEVDFCGYSVPHPSEPKMNLRLQTTGRPALEVLKEGLRDLRDLCNILEERVEDEIPDAPREQGQGQEQEEDDDDEEF